MDPELNDPRRTLRTGRQLMLVILIGFWVGVGASVAAVWALAGLLMSSEPYFREFLVAGWVLVILAALCWTGVHIYSLHALALDEPDAVEVLLQATITGILVLGLAMWYRDGHFVGLLWCVSILVLLLDLFMVLVVLLARKSAGQ